MKYCIAAVLNLQLLLWTYPSLAQNFPGYELKPIDYRCSAVAEDASYNTAFLRSFKYLSVGKEDWLFRSNSDLLTEFGPDAENLNALNAFAKALNAKGTQLMLVYVPTRGLLHHDFLASPQRESFNFPLALSNYEGALKRVRDQGILVADYTRLINSDNAKDYFFKTDIHWTPIGAQATAKLVADFLKSQPIYSGLDKMDFINTPAGFYRPGYGAMKIAWQKLCGQQFRKEIARKYQHELAPNSNSQSDGANALFGDQAAPQVAIVGTSFSATLGLNFVGFLREYLHIDILNEAVSGGAFDGAMTQYLGSRGFQEAPPKLLIWEVQSYFNLNAKYFYREIVPLVNDGCNNRTVLLSEDVKLHAGKNEILLNSESTESEKVGNFLNEDHIIDLQFSDPNFRNLDATLWQLNGRSDVVSIKRARRVQANGRYVFSLRSDADWGKLVYLSTEINVPEEFKTMSVKARLCHK